MVLLTISGYAQFAYGKDSGVSFTLGGPTKSLKTQPSREVTKDFSAIGKLIDEGRRLNKPYILQAVTVLIRMSDVTNETRKERQVNWRIVYSIHALQPIKPTDRLFKESYSSAYANVRRWFGSEREIQATDSAYNVMLDIPEGESRTIVTGATFIYDLPLSPDRPGFGQTILLAPDQEFFSYPTGDDLIGELTMLIESDTVKFSPVGEATRHSLPNGTFVPNEEFRFDVGLGRRVLSAHWRGLMPNEEVGLHFRIE
jgi:hypothetical protein